MMNGVSLKSVRKSYGDVPVIHGVDLDIKQGEFMVFVGPSGCGKSTLLRMIAGLEDISSGDISIEGSVVNDVPPAQRGIAMVFQNYALYPHMTVAENMGFSLLMAGMDKRSIDTSVQQAAEILRITNLLDRKPKALSGGQRQRVAIGRAIVRKPKVFLFDEPLSNLDAELRVQMRLELSQMHKTLGTTMIYVTHDQVEAMTLGERIAIFNAGRIEQVGRPLDLYNQPNGKFVAGFLGSPNMNFLAVSPHTSDGVCWLIFTNGEKLPMPADTQPESFDSITTLGIRPEHLHPSTQEGLKAELQLLEHLGDVVIAYCKLECSDAPVALKLSVAEGAALKAGDHIRVAPSLQNAVFLDQTGRAVR